MTQTYDIFERFSDGSTLWRASALGIQDAMDLLDEFALKTANECYAMNVQTGQVLTPTKDSALRAAHA